MIRQIRRSWFERLFSLPWFPLEQYRYEQEPDRDAEQVRLIKEALAARGAFPSNPPPVLKLIQACPKCEGLLKPGVALESTSTGTADFPGGETVTMSPGGPGKLVECLKCIDCGFSVTK